MKWEKVKLSEVTEYITDGDHQPAPKSDSGVLFVKIKDIQDNRLTFDNALFVPQEYYNRLPKNRKAEYGDTLYTVVGSYGIPAFVNHNIPFCFERNIALLHPNNRVIPKYLYYAVNNIANGSAQKLIPLSKLAGMEISVPPIERQETIVNILSAYDDLIENNQKQIKLLEEAAQRLQKKSQDSFKDATDDGSTHNSAVSNHTAAHCCGNRVEHTDKAGGGAHYNRNLSADGTDREQLNQGDNAGNQHGVLQKMQLQVGKFAAGNAAGAGDNQQGSQVPDKHGKYMLQAKGNCLFQRHFTVELKSSFGQLVRFLHRKTSLPFFSADKYIILPQRSKLSNMQENVFLSREKRRKNCEFFSNERKNA